MFGITSATVLFICTFMLMLVIHTCVYGVAYLIKNLFPDDNDVETQTGRVGQILAIITLILVLADLWAPFLFYVIGTTRGIAQGQFSMIEVTFVGAAGIAVQYWLHKNEAYRDTEIGKWVDGVFMKLFVGWDPKFGASLHTHALVWAAIAGFIIGLTVFLIAP